MARINTNVSSLIARTDMARTQRSLNTALQRLSSGLRINRGADDPAGLIASEALRSEIAGINAAIDNSQRASNVISTAEGALNEVAALLINIKELTVEAANTGGMSSDEIRANQLQIDSAVQSITRIANVTNFAGLNLLDGSMDYILSGVAGSAIDRAQVFNAQFGSASTLPINVDVLVSARPAQLEWRNSAVANRVVIEVRGNRGVESFSFASGAGAATVLDAINNTKEATGVSGVYRNGDPNSGIVFYSTDWGSEQFVSVNVLGDQGSFSTVDSAGAGANRVTGRDVAATVNGSYTVGNGLNLSLNTTYLSMDLQLDSTLGAGSTSFNITGGGAQFQLGPHVSINEQRSVGIQSITATSLGSSTLGYLSQIVTGGAYSLTEVGGTSRAAMIVDQAISQVSSLRGRLGAFEKNTLQTNIASLEVALENVTSSESAIRDADFAKETAAMTRGQILSNAAMSVLSIANSSPQQVLQLLQG